MTGGQQDTTGGFANPDEVASSGGTEDAILSHEELLNTVGGTDLSDLGNHLGVVVAAITTNDKERVLDTFGNGKKNAGNEGLGVVCLLEDLDLLSETRAKRLLIKWAMANQCEYTYVPGFWSVKG